jgi:hypothetical protein
MNVRFAGAVAALFVGLSLSAASASGDWTLPNIVYGSGLVGVAQVGVANSFVAELTDRKDMLSRADSQAFIDDYFAHFSKVLPDDASRASLASLRKLLVVDENFDHDRNLHAFQDGMGPLLRALPRERQRAFFVGMLAEQVYYNSMVLRETPSDEQFRSVLGSLDTLDAKIPGLAADRAALASYATGDWPAIQAKSGKILMAILNAK